MKIGFVDCITNDYDVYEIAVKAANSVSTDVNLSRFTAPDLLKVPVCCKRVLEGGADVGLVFLNLTEEDADSFHLLLEKNIDVELATGKFVFFCVVNRDEYRSPEQLGQIASGRIAAFVDLIAKMQLSPSEISKQIGTELPAELAGISAGIAAITGGAPPAEEGTGNPLAEADKAIFGNDSTQESGKSLF